MGVRSIADERMDLGVLQGAHGSGVNGEEWRVWEMRV